MIVSLNIGITYGTLNDTLKLADTEHIMCDVATKKEKKKKKISILKLLNFRGKSGFRRLTMATDKRQSLKIHFPLTILTKALTFCFFSIKELPAQQIKNGQYSRPKPLLNL